MKLLIIINIEESNYEIRSWQRIKVEEIERNDNDVITYTVMIDIVTGEEYSWSGILENKLTEIN